MEVGLCKKKENVLYFCTITIMKKISKIASLLIAFSLSAFAFGETTMDDVLYSITSHKVTSGDFNQEKTAPNLKRALKSSGNFIFSETGILWKTVKPFPSTMAVTPDTLIMTAANGTRTVTDGSANEVFKSVAATLTALFSGSRSELEKYFTITNFSVDSSSWKMSLKPKDSTIGQALKEIIISGVPNEKKSVMNGMTVYQSDSSTTKYELLNQVYKEELSNEEKTFFIK